MGLLNKKRYVMAVPATAPARKVDVKGEDVVAQQVDESGFELCSPARET